MLGHLNFGFFLLISICFCNGAGEPFPDPKNPGIFYLEKDASGKISFYGCNSRNGGGDIIKIGQSWTVFFDKNASLGVGYKCHCSNHSSTCSGCTDGTNEYAAGKSFIKNGNTFVCQKEGKAWRLTLSQSVVPTCAKEGAQEIRDGYQYTCKGGHWKITACQFRLPNKTDLYADLGQTIDSHLSYRMTCKKSNEGVIYLERSACIDDGGKVLQPGEKTTYPDGSSINCVLQDGILSRIIKGGGTGQIPRSVGDRYVQNEVVVEVNGKDGETKAVGCSLTGSPADVFTGETVKNGVRVNCFPTSGGYSVEPKGCVTRDGLILDKQSETVPDKDNTSSICYEGNGTSELLFLTINPAGCKLPSGKYIHPFTFYRDLKTLPDSKEPYIAYYECDSAGPGYGLFPRGIEFGREGLNRPGTILTYSGKNYAVSKSPTNGEMIVTVVDDKSLECHALGKVYQHGQSFADSANTSTYQCFQGTVQPLQCLMRDKVITAGGMMYCGDDAFICPLQGGGTVQIPQRGCTYLGKEYKYGEYFWLVGGAVKYCYYTRTPDGYFISTPQPKGCSQNNTKLEPAENTIGQIVKLNNGTKARCTTDGYEVITEEDEKCMEKMKDSSICFPCQGCANGNGTDGPTTVGPAQGVTNAPGTAPPTILPGTAGTGLTEGVPSEATAGTGPSKKPSDATAATGEPGTHPTDKPEVEGTGATERPDGHPSDKPEVGGTGATEGPDGRPSDKPEVGGTGATEGPDGRPSDKPEVGGTGATEGPDGRPSDKPEVGGTGATEGPDGRPSDKPEVGGTGATEGPDGRPSDKPEVGGTGATEGPDGRPSDKPEVGGTGATEGPDGRPSDKPEVGGTGATEGPDGRPSDKPEVGGTGATEGPDGRPSDKPEVGGTGATEGTDGRPSDKPEVGGTGATEGPDGQPSDKPEVGGTGATEGPDGRPSDKPEVGGTRATEGPDETGTAPTDFPIGETDETDETDGTGITGRTRRPPRTRGTGSPRTRRPPRTRGTGEPGTEPTEPTEEDTDETEEPEGTEPTEPTEIDETAGTGVPVSGRTRPPRTRGTGSPRTRRPPRTRGTGEPGTEPTEPTEEDTDETEEPEGTEPTEPTEIDETAGTGVPVSGRTRPPRTRGTGSPRTRRPPRTRGTGEPGTEPTEPTEEDTDETEEPEGTEPTEPTEIDETAGTGVPVSGRTRPPRTRGTGSPRTRRPPRTRGTGEPGTEPTEPTEEDTDETEEPEGTEPTEPTEIDETAGTGVPVSGRTRPPRTRGTGSPRTRRPPRTRGTGEPGTEPTEPTEEDTDETEEPEGTEPTEPTEIDETAGTGVPVSGRTRPPRTRGTGSPRTRRPPRTRGTGEPGTEPTEPTEEDTDDTKEPGVGPTEPSENTGDTGATTKKQPSKDATAAPSDGYCVMACSPDQKIKSLRNGRDDYPSNSGVIENRRALMSRFSTTISSGAESLKWLHLHLEDYLEVVVPFEERKEAEALIEFIRALW